jgi:hypothetical protein
MQLPAPLEEWGHKISHRWQGCRDEASSLLSAPGWFVGVREFQFLPEETLSVTLYLRYDLSWASSYEAVMLAKYFTSRVSLGGWLLR